MIELPGLGRARVVCADSRHLSGLRDDSVDLVCTSPPYFALRSYQDGGAHYAGQVGDEPTPTEYVDSLIEVTRECVRVLKPSGSLWVNLGDKYQNQGGSNGHTALEGVGRFAGGQPVRRFQTSVPQKSLIGIPWRYALRCIDDLGLILRAEVIWSKPNGLPESVTDRVRRSHEVWFHFTLEGRYYSAVDEIREPHAPATLSRNQYLRTAGPAGGTNGASNGTLREDRIGDLSNPLGKLPGSVWTIPTEPLIIPESVAHAVCCNGRAKRDRAGKITCTDGLDHFAAFPTEWPRRIIQGWSPRGVCTVCNEGRRPVVERESEARRPSGAQFIGKRTVNARNAQGANRAADVTTLSTITGYACACTPWHMEPTPTDRDPDNQVLIYDWHLWDPPATTPGVVLDPFGGTGTTAMVAKALGRDGITVDMSSDYCRIAEWRVNDRDQLAKVLGIEKAPQPHPDEQSLLDLLGGEVS